jgi:methyl-accepting chemotaxis protein
LEWIASNTTIKQRIWFGFSLLLVILITVSLSTLLQFATLSSGINKLTDKIQPAVMSSQSLSFHLESASHALGFYMLTREPQYKDKYSASMLKAKQTMLSLQGFEYISANATYRSEAQKIAGYIEKLSGYEHHIIELVSNDDLNSPAMQIAGEKLNPMAQQMQGMISQMILSEWGEGNSDEERSEFRQKLYDIRYYNAQLLGELRTFLAFRSDNNIDNMKSLNEVLDQKVEALAAAEDLLTFEQADILPAYQEMRTEYKQVLNQTIAIHSSDKYRNDIYLTKTEIGPIIADIQQELLKLVGFLRNDIAAESTALQDGAGNAGSKVVSGVVIGVLIGIVIAFFMARMITVPINEVVYAFEDLAEGDGDLTHRLNSQGRSEISRLSRGFNRFADKVHNLVSEVAAGVQHLSQVVADVSAIVDQTQHGSQQQRAQTENAASAIEQMSTTVQVVADNARQAAESAQQADDNARSGQVVVSETVSSINTLANEIETGVDVIGELVKGVEAIGSVLNVITSISEQTNLLALNAAIEAARAGEQGRGFAVVADEVRTLASRTQQSASEIQTMINNLQTRAHAAVDAITSGQKTAQISVQNASDAGEALTAITDSVATINTMNMQIATSSEQQSGAARDINQNVTQISRVAEQNAAASDKLADSSHNLAALADELNGLVSQFKY